MVDAPECGNGWNYLIYGVLGGLVMISESIGLSTKMQQNSILEVVHHGVKWILSKRPTPGPIPAPPTPPALEVALAQV
jgi:hypothetical protein